MAGWIEMPLGMEVGLGPRDFVLDGTQLPAPQKVGAAPSPIFGPCPLWPNSWMDQDGTWYGGGPGPGHIVLDGDPAALPKKVGGAPSPIFGPFLLGQTAGCIQMLLGMEVDLSPGDCVRWALSPLPKKGTEPPPIFGPCLL